MRKSISISVLPLALLTSCLLVAPASATTGHGPRYSLSVIEGETTLPEYRQVASTGASVQPSAQIAVSIVRGGLTVYRDVQENGSAWLSQVPQVGDVVTLESPVGTLIESVTYDGLPAIDPTVCVGSTNFSGENTSGYTVEGSYIDYSLEHDRYGRVSGVHESNFSEAQVKSLTGTTFGGSFLKPLAAGETVAAVESLKIPLPGEGTSTYTSEFDRPVGACPPPPLPPYVPPAIPALAGSIAKLLKTSIHGFLHFGARDQVTINQPGTVIQDLYLSGGKLPAFAAAKSRHHKLPPALLLARGSTTATAAGKVSVLLKLTAKGRRKLKSSHKLNAVLITTLRSSAGAKIDLQRRSISLHR